MTSDARLRADLDLLTEVAKDGAASQLSLSKRVGIAVGLLNALLRRAIRKGYVKARQAPAKRYVYYLTPKGFAEKARLVAAYVEASLGFFRQSRGEYIDLFDAARARGWRRVALAGASELAEIAVIAAAQSDAELVGVLDPATNRTRFVGLPVLRSLAQAEPFDAVVLTDSHAPQATFDWLAAELSSDRVLVPPLLRIRAGGVARPRAKDLSVASVGR